VCPNKKGAYRRHAPAPPSNPQKKIETKEFASTIVSLQFSAIKDHPLTIDDEAALTPTNAPPRLPFLFTA
jgi:hypothetical protein